MNCELCELKKITHWYYECGDFVIIECKSCRLPMAVWRNHTMDLKPECEKRMETKLIEVANEFYKDKHWKIDKVQRKIPNHLHWHVRPSLF